MPPHGYRPDATLRLARLFHLLIHIRQAEAKHRPPMARDLMRVVDCSRSTLYRELAFLAGEQLIGRDERGGYILLDRGLSFPMAPLTPEDAFALALARVVLDRPGVPLRAEIGAALDRAASALPPRIRELFRQAGDDRRSGMPSGEEANAALVPMISGWLERRTISMDYDSGSSGRRWRRIDPYRVTAESGYWMVDGWCHERRVIRSFALANVLAAEATERHFTRNEPAWTAFLAEEGVFLGLRGGDPVAVHVRFSPEVARWALRSHRWPHGMTATREPDGSVLLTGTARGVDGIRNELLRWRRHAHVIGGPELRLAYQEEVAAMATAHEIFPADSEPSHTGETAPAEY